MANWKFFLLNFNNSSTIYYIIYIVVLTFLYFNRKFTCNSVIKTSSSGKACLAYPEPSQVPEEGAPRPVGERCLGVAGVAATPRKILLLWLTAVRPAGRPAAPPYPSRCPQAQV